MPASFTDAVMAVQAGAATVGSVDDLVQLVVVVESLMSRPVGRRRTWSRSCRGR